MTTSGSTFGNLFGKAPGAQSRLGQYLDADYYRTVKRLAKGQIDHKSLLAEISGADPMRKETLRNVRHLAESETVRIWNSVAAGTHI